jgi:hypothetical protein
MERDTLFLEFAEPKGTATTGTLNEKNVLRGWRVNGPVDKAVRCVIED